MNYQINIPEMKRKTEIEEILLMEINKNLLKYKNEIEWIKKNFYPDDVNLLSTEHANNKNKQKYKFEDLYNNKFSQSQDNEKLKKKLLEYPNTIYSIFQFFYSKRKNYMGMNLTGLVQGKMETGLGFRTSIIKYNSKNLKDLELKKIILSKYKNETDDINVYKVNSNSFSWDEFYQKGDFHPEVKFTYYYVVANLSLKKFFILLEK